MKNGNGISLRNALMRLCMHTYINHKSYLVLYLLRVSFVHKSVIDLLSLILDLQDEQCLVFAVIVSAVAADICADHL